MSTEDLPVVLVVDDNRLNIDLLVDILKDDYMLLVALNGETALELVHDTLPDLILLDIMMPVMDGYEVCKRLKSDPRTMRIPVIFVTAKSQTEDEAKGLELGAVDYITKPVTPAIVQARLKTHLALYNQNRELEDKVARRTAELEESMVKADEASRAKSVFLANISHELRTPLNHILGLSSLLLDMDEDAERLELIQPINDGAAHLTDLFDQLLDLTLLESKVVKFDFKDFDLPDMLTRQAGIFRTYGEKKGVAFEFELDDALPTIVHGAASGISQALHNVLTNAFRYTQVGTVTLKARIDPDNYPGTDRDRIQLRLSVSDTGVGIPDDKLEAIFKSFEIGEKVMTKRLSGSGVGLTISKYLMEELGGKIWVESTLGQGSTFHLSLPLTVADATR